MTRAGQAPPQRRLRSRRLFSAFAGTQLERNSETRRGHAGCRLGFRGRYRLGEHEARGSQQEEKFTGPGQNVQNSSALEIVTVSGMQADCEGLSSELAREGAP